MTLHTAHVSKRQLTKMLEELDARVSGGGDPTFHIETFGMFHCRQETLYLTRRNIVSLLSKLQRRENGEETKCSIIKNDTQHRKYPCSSKILVIAFFHECVSPSSSTLIYPVENSEYYTDRAPGAVYPADERSIAA